jgi:hypothetical protein
MTVDSNEAHRNVMKKSEIDKEMAIPVLLACKSYKEAADKLEINVKTIFSWLQDPDFCRKLEEVRLLVMRDSIGRLKAGASAAIDVLMMSLADPDPAIRLKSAGLILGNLSKFTVEPKQAQAYGSTLEAILDLVREKQKLREVAAQS